MQAKKHLVTQLNKIILDERLYANRRLLAVLTVAMLRGDKDESVFFRDLIKAQFINGSGLRLGGEDGANNSPQTNLEKEAAISIKDLLNQVGLGGPSDEQLNTEPIQ